MKKLIAAAISAAFVAPVAFADVTIYGSIRYSLDYNNYGNNPYGATPNNKATGWDQSSRIGFKGVDKWDDSSFATIWQVESAQGAKDANGNKSLGGTNWGTRNNFIGVQSNNYGTLRVGNYDSAYKTLLTSSNLSSIFDNFADDGDFKGNKAVFAQLNARLNSSFSYDSPVFSGFQVRTTYGQDTATTIGKGAPIVGVSGLYTNGGLVLGLTDQYARNRTFSNVAGITDATNNVGTNVTSGASVNGTEVAVGYKFDVAQIGAGWEHISDKRPTGTFTWNNYVVTGNYNFSPKLQAQGLYGYSRKYLGVDGQNGQQGTLGLVYFTTKQTRLYTYLVHLKNDAAKGGASFQNNSGSLVALPGETSNQFSVGMRTDF
ncbi:porin [Andreprevotia chitinilytica]|uniref:porin n=1 Tax=Andreprevotia chitinilytica TaxID=396808 RepID=UPI0005558602|nr:porin [Andreprevotia chitinilytica]